MRYLNWFLRRNPCPTNFGFISTLALSTLITSPGLTAFTTSIYGSPLFTVRNARPSSRRFLSADRGFCSFESNDDDVTHSNILSPFPTSSHQTSGFVHHFVAHSNHTGRTLEEVIQEVLMCLPIHNNNNNNNNTTNPTPTTLQSNTTLSAFDLLNFGAVWFMSAENAARGPISGIKPTRLTAEHSTTTVTEGDYLRIHFSPRRFLQVYNYNWSAPISESPVNGIIVDENSHQGWLVIRKPAMVPVHRTVDNARENVADCLRQARNNHHAYISTPQRLDQNTSGLLVVATSKPFAAYFADLLRKKTATHLENSREDAGDYSRGAIHKTYRCLVCVLSHPNDKNTDLETIVQPLRHYSQENHIIRHYLEPSIRAPKNYEKTQREENWLESLLRIRSVGKVYPIVGSRHAERLSEHLWPGGTPDAPSIPPLCRGVVELEIELLTGRTHQIRGQLSSENFPICGDVSYNGAVPSDPTQMTEYSQSTERLALQCSELSFLEPNVIEKDGEIVLHRSSNWLKFELADAWWTPHLEEYVSSDQNSSSTEKEHKNAPERHEPLRPELLPPRVSLSPGKNKYVLIRATNPSTNEHFWFVKSASPSECGGPYHGNVAQDLREWIEAAGYDVETTGGGRIDYDPELQRAIVYGFSYGFGKGDHEKAADLINKHSNDQIFATFDNREGLY